MTTFPLDFLQLQFYHFNIAAILLEFLGGILAVSRPKSGLVLSM